MLMKDKIVEALRALEQSRHLRILYACESGSRAWGFPSPDSDYDVRFLYAKPLDWYLQLNTPKDVINQEIDALLDISGWEIRKCMQLMVKSNASPFEWMQSPIIYLEQPEFLTSFRHLAKDCFSPIASIHHYLGLAKKYHAAINTNTPAKLKSWFYALRASLSARWIATHQSIPPLAFDALLPLINDQPSIVQRIRDLVELKATKEECYLFEGDAAILQIVEAAIYFSDQSRSTLSNGQPDMAALHSFLQKVIKNDD